MSGAHATAGHPLHVERITLREIRLPLLSESNRLPEAAAAFLRAYELR